MLDTLWILLASLVHLVAWALTDALNTMTSLDLGGNSPSLSSSSSRAIFQDHTLLGPA